MIFFTLKFPSVMLYFSLFTGFPAAAYAAYAAGRGFSGYPSFGLPYPTGNLNLATLHHHLTNHHLHHPLLSSCHPALHHPLEHLALLSHAHHNSMHL